MKASTYINVVLAVIISLAACTDKSLNPIFYTLENERSLAEDRGLEDDMTVHKVVKVGTRYFAAANQLYSRTVTGNWIEIDPPVSGAMCNTIAVYDPDGAGILSDHLFAGFFAKDGTGLGVYYASNPDSISWQPVPDVQNVQVNFLKVAGPAAGEFLFVSREGGSSEYSLWYSSDPLTASSFVESTNAAIFPPSGAVPITDIEYDNTNYWVTAGPFLYSGGLGSLAVVVGGPTNPGTYPFGGLLYTTKLYVSTKDGELWSYNGAWAGPASIDVDGEAVRFTRFVDVTAVSTDVIVGTEGTGYYELIGGDETNTVRRPDYNISGLYKGAINSFFFDTAESSLFACTTGAGLWRANYTAGEWLWFQE